jgi:hypothetical protein
MNSSGNIINEFTSQKRIFLFFLYFDVLLIMKIFIREYHYYKGLKMINIFLSSRQLITYNFKQECLNRSSGLRFFVDLWELNLIVTDKLNQQLLKQAGTKNVIG